MGDLQREVELRQEQETALKEVPYGFLFHDHLTSGACLGISG